MNMRQLAWDGFVFEVPENWELARYRYASGGRALIKVEDEVSLRLELEWMSPRTVQQARRFMTQATRYLEKMIARADRQTDFSGLPAGWRATHCEYREILATGRRQGNLGVVQHHLVTAVFAPADRELRCLLRLHFLPGDPEDPKRLTERIIRSFSVPGGDRVQWRVFDLDLDLDAGFALEATSFDIGAKLLLFRYRTRRLYLWTLSCADHILKDGVNETEWVVGFLNAQRRVPGIVFRAEPDGTVAWRRRGLLAFVQRDETARWCFQYTIGFRRDPGRNQIAIWVFNHRHREDLDWICPYPGCPKA